MSFPNGFPNAFRLKREYTREEQLAVFPAEILDKLHLPEVRERVLETIIQDALEMFRKKNPGAEPYDVLDHCTQPFRGEEGGERLEEIIKNALLRVLEREKEEKEKEGKENNHKVTEDKDDVKVSCETIRYYRALGAEVRKSELHRAARQKDKVKKPKREVSGDKVEAKEESGVQGWDAIHGWWNWAGEVRWEGM
ncbi:hypothetical protein K440DRAFT_664963 [Wilcoxina mikolae CBS 423.85]|nr:hypothetical protein K440DRAFT_664963 [Wilcoxina mikolae CBS 423.85]